MKRKAEEGGIRSQCDHGKKWLRGEVIGRGCFTSVYLATLKRSKLRFCYFPPVMAVKSAAVSVSTYLQKEREVLDNLVGCPNVIKCYGEEITRSEKDGMVYNVLLEYASGGTLADNIKNSGRPGLPELDVQRYTRSILRALIHIHGCRYVHCDLKPDNIFLVSRPDTSRNTDELTAKVGDFGSAKRVPRMKGGRVNPSLRGTLLYMAPETVNDHIQGRSSDIWALGCIVLEMLTGQPPWPMNPDMNSETLRLLIGNENELPKIPSGISDEAKEFLNGCFVRRAKFRLTAKMLFNHPFVAGLDDEFVENITEYPFISDGVELVYSSSYDSNSDCEDDLSSCSWSDDAEEMETAISEASAEESQVQSENKGKNLSSGCHREDVIKGIEGSSTVRASLEELRRFKFRDHRFQPFKPGKEKIGEIILKLALFSGSASHLVDGILIIRKFIRGLKSSKGNPENEGYL